MLKRMFASKEVKAMLGVLDEADQKFDCHIFQTIKSQIEQAVLSDPNAVTVKIQDGLSPRQAVYSMIANTAGDLAESGNYHVYRGVLNPLTGGEDLLRIFDASVDEMVQCGAVDSDYATEQKAGVRENIKSVG